jgi:(R,R)-butanediol dehydrogenase / meso-butanediol dehydrogenase / diacetyl reductase
MEAVVYRGARKLEIEDRVAEAIRLVAVGAVPTTQLISGTVPIHAVDAAFAVLERGGGVMKVLLDWQGSAL